MPHDVIMPALGMAQDTGLIVSWLKQQGDAVKTGDALMEVETDKAVMEVEALADGFLVDVRAAAGDNVPVGQVIAVIAETADATIATSKETTPEVTVDQLVQVSDGQPIIMPALGMAQDTGLIVAWHKKPGDSVLADDVLLEVETDKSTMEVPAGHDGYIAALLAEAGQDVPVGDVIAIISADKPEAPVQRKATSPKANTAPVAKAIVPKTPTPAKAAPHPVPASGGKILASPKARRLALEQGLDLSRLEASGHPQPYHVSDLEVLRALPMVATGAQQIHMTDQQICAVVPTSGTVDFLAQMLDEGGIAIAVTTLWSSFAAAAFRDATQTDASVIVELSSLSGPVIFSADPDRARLSKQPETIEDAAPTLALRDISSSSITSMRLSAKDIPTLTIGSDGNSYKISLDFTAAQLSETEAIGLITGFAARMDDPLHHLL